ncbi:MAG: N-acetylmuramoyl-L-alanine amidase [Candidatus Edwardsbacteria bacterium]|nr:N-acetylmuramoyl-L-alanine amidase [Candidatus Edwardsbacteria bacterium]MBU1576404.1 N-acetylmuramoyl-L-alanine amidase [Candidatus Edwardsbacteria bacterium]MBU2463480.1 N-acetylmuramoyl-L-alanine amidase [Candidatus Edwardsbacteria bacterium]MBU2593582.1 N-acetylmuramoyl-L-alanine amidase [Candidatus Edwardsbacteria bacterium]
MKKISLILILLIAAGSAQSAPKIDLVYPPEGADIGPVSWSFILGSVTPGSQLSVNGRKVDVYKTGAFLAYIPFDSGEFIIQLSALDASGIATLDRKVNVAQRKRTIRPDSLCILHGSINPNYNLSLPVGERLYVSFQGTPGCKASFSVGRSLGFPMQEQNAATEADDKILAFSDSSTADTSVVPGIYGGSCLIQGSEGWESQRIYFYLVDLLGNAVIDSTGPIISNWDDTRQVFAKVKDSIAVLKTAPGLGYEMFMPRGMILQINGIHDQYYRLKLTETKEAWVKKSSVEFFPAGKIFRTAKLALVKTAKAARGSQLSISLSRPSVYQVFPGSDGRSLKILLYDVQADMDWVRYDPADGFVNDIRWRQVDSRTVELEMSLNNKLWGYSAAYQKNTLVLSLTAPPAINKKNPFKGLKIALDPGHSPDNGAVGPLRTLEKDINWQITQRLGRMLKKEGASVLYTRENGEGASIYQRPSRAAGWKADLLVSIHNNASPDGANPLLNSGYSTYYYQPYSRGLAETVHRQFQKNLPLNDHGLFYGNLVLCRATEFPSILVEPAFIIVPREEALLLDGAFQEKIAKAVYTGIKEFLLNTK